MKSLSICIGLLVLLKSGFVVAEDLTGEARSEIITQVIDQLADRYVDPNLGQTAAKVIQQKKKQQAYDRLDQKLGLIKALVTDMHAVTNDKHLQLVNPKNTAQPVSSGAGQTTQQIVASDLDAMAQNKMIPKHMLQQLLKGINYGLRNAKVLDGDIAYLDIREFISPKMAPEVFEAIDDTIKPLLDCSALILDLRFCSNNGSPETVMYIASYLFDGEESLLLYELYDRENKKIAKFRTRTDVPGKRLPDVPVYILVSSKTYSAGEMLAYGLQKVGRATVVGETSAGSAHGIERIDIGHGIMMVLPVDRLVHVKTKANWERTGVIPNVPVKTDDALTTAKDKIQKAKRDNK
jgi:C-terminal processing protease CtpA/Prc